MLEVKRQRTPSRRAVEGFIQQLKRREVTMRLHNALRLTAGLAVISVVLAVLPWCVNKALHFFDLQPADVHVHIPRWQWLLIDAAVLLMTLPLAIAMHKESRADTAWQFLDSGSSTRIPAASAEDLLMLIPVMIACLGLLQGEFLLIDALKTTLLRLRLAGVDRYRAATIVAMLAARPAGLSPEELIDPGEAPERFRKTIASLMVFGWVDLAPKGDHIMLLSPVRRALRG